MRNQPVSTRFAPSPTGYLHLGHLYAALFARDLAVKHGGRFLLRFEDIDTTRVRDHFYDATEEDLHFAGIEWEETPLRQTTRFEQYANALEKLKQLGVVYPCFCTRKDIERELNNLTRAPHGPDGPLYPGTCKQLNTNQIQQKLKDHKVPAWRLDASKALQLTGELTFYDSMRGTISVNPHLLGDLVLARKDIGTSYHIAVVVDDAYQNITDITRGKDLLESTHLHRILQYLLRFPEPRYHHHDLVCDSHGERLAKRDAALSIRELRNQGRTALELINLCQAHLS
ncbi:tRNA glutamyl-Q(34) synthetase GluQRS [Rubritalea spongiae]|uniref:tRNA glutamyl-Q(34) synthetase GluQRS n=1 Tax=Rubritalea spongiae TaxID=430797 RepID=A0ABW5E6I6_9BACT